MAACRGDYSGQRNNRIPYITCATCRYTLKVLSDIGDGEKINDQIIVDWVNSTLQKGQKQSTISNFKVRAYTTIQHI